MSQESLRYVRSGAPGRVPLGVGPLLGENQDPAHHAEPFTHVEPAPVATLAALLAGRRTIRLPALPTSTFEADFEGALRGAKDSLDVAGCGSIGRNDDQVPNTIAQNWITSWSRRARVDVTSPGPLFSSTSALSLWSLPPVARRVPIMRRVVVVR